MEELKARPTKSSSLTPLVFLERAATVYGDCPSVIYNNTTYTWGHNMVFVVAPNIPAMYKLQFAVPMSGAILNNINTCLEACTISTLLIHSEYKLVFVDCLSLPLIIEAISLFPQHVNPLRLILITDDEISSIDDFHDTYKGLVRPENDSAPKGVVHSHRGTTLAALDRLKDWSVPKQPVYLWTLPMFHGNGWCFSWGMAAVGCTNICLRRFDATIVYRLIEKHGVTHMCGAPMVLNMLSNSPTAKPLKNPVQVLTAGSPPPATILHKSESMGFVVSHGYGSTETVRTIGMSEVEVVDKESGMSVKRDGLTTGEIVLRGGCLMLGYLKDLVATSKCMRENRWFYTRDVGLIHPDGYLEIKDRSKDVIISGRENLSSVEVKSMLYTHPKINEAAVVARPDEFWGETPYAFVSLKGSSKKPSEKEIMEFCKERLAHYMVPKTVVFKDELPKTSTGKIQKFELRQTAKAMGSPRVLSRM
ncbi:hypothetical protein ACB098_10G130400 [Castanea mollissima]